MKYPEEEDSSFRNNGIMYFPNCEASLALFVHYSVVLE